MFVAQPHKFVYTLKVTNLMITTPDNLSNGQRKILEAYQHSIYITMSLNSTKLRPWCEFLSEFLLLDFYVPFLASWNKLAQTRKVQ